MSIQKKVIAIDVGNSNTTFAVVNLTDNTIAYKKKIVTTSVIEFANEFYKYIKNDISDLSSINISSVITGMESEIFNSLEKLNILPLKTLLKNDSLPITLEYENSEKLGTDRVANALFVNHYFKNESSIIIDVGTAVTVDFQTDENSFLGGYIFPGIALQLNTLSKNTEKLPLVEINRESFTNAIPKNTEQAILNGVALSVAGGVNLAVTQIKNNNSVKNIFTTGGGWGDIEPYINFNFQYIKDLTILGIASL